MIINLPHNFKPRHYQRDFLKALFIDQKKHLLGIWHRRAGKTITCCNAITGKAAERVGSYFQFLPTLNQARKVVWEGIGKDGIRFLDHFPSQFIHKINHSEMKIVFKNGSIFRLLGTDNQTFNRNVGTNAVGIIYDEFALQDPSAREYMLPILVENEGWEIIASTPRGHNHLYQLYNKVKGFDEWYTSLLTVKDTFQNNGQPVVNKTIIDEYKVKHDFSDDKIRQEFYCDFDAAILGSIFGPYIQKAQQEGRISDFEIDRTYPVYTYWDLGWRDATAIWFLQKCKDGFKVINFYQNSQQEISHYINYLHDFRDLHQIVYSTHYAPFDANKTNLGTGLTLTDQAIKLGLNFSVLPQPRDKQLLIEVGRGLFNQFYFHQTRCEKGMNALREYQKSFNALMGTFGAPLHNWASHAADAYLYMCQEIRLSKDSTGMQVIKNAVNSESIY